MVCYKFSNKKQRLTSCVIKPDLILSNELAPFNRTSTQENFLKKWFCNLWVDVSNIPAISRTGKMVKIMLLSNLEGINTHEHRMTYTKL